MDVIGIGPPSLGDPRGASAPDDVAEDAPILVTGICGRLGRRLARRLHRRAGVLGLDRRPFDLGPKDVEHHRIDLRRANKVRDLFRHRPIAAVVHLGVLHDPRASQDEHHAVNVEGFARLLDCVAQYDVKKLVVLSSANVYGPRPENPQFLVEDTPLLAGARFSDIRDLVDVDMLAQSFFWKRPDVETVVLRPVHIVGPVRNAPSNYLRLPAIPTLLGFDPMVQIIHVDDVVSAIEAALAPGVRGIFNVAGPPPLPLSRLIAATGRPSFPVPYSLARSAMKNLWRVRATSFPVPELDHIRYVCMVDDGRARESLGHAPRHDVRRAIEALDDPW